MKINLAGPLISEPDTSSDPIAIPDNYNSDLPWTDEHVKDINPSSDPSAGPFDL